MPKYQFTRPGTWDYPSLFLQLVQNDVVELTGAPDSWFTQVADGTAVTKTPGYPPASFTPQVSPADGTVAVWDGTARQAVFKTPAAAGLLTETVGKGTYAALNPTLTGVVLDGVGNMTSWVENGVACSATYDGQGNMLTLTTGTLTRSITYDGSGNLLGAA